MSESTKPSRLSVLLTEDRPLVMGVLNVTPDSFYDGGKYATLATALQQAQKMIQEGVDIIDIGGESSRPGAIAVSLEEELDRTMPVVNKIRDQFDTCLSIDTSSAVVMREAASAGVDMINDIRALGRGEALQAAAQTRLPVCLMHMQGEPENMQQNPNYQDLIQELLAFFKQRINVCLQAGITAESILLDPGFGFGKTPEHNLRLIKHLAAFKSLGKPLLVGLSRKSTIGLICDDLLGGSLAGAVVAAQKGANIVRVHDVAETVSAFKVMRAIQEEQAV